MIEPERVMEKIIRTPGFREHVFTEQESEAAESCASPAEHYAGRFAAKEALLKAAGKGLPGANNLSDLAVVTDESGQPFFRIADEARQMLGLTPASRIHLSISHLKAVACAVVVIEDI
jgi:holo-[acyl-carrier protein] synthase